MLTFSNPRCTAEFNDWPIGGANRGQCKFAVERNNRGERVSRQTTNKHGVWCKPKYSNYGKEACIVDGSDGKTYILLANNSGFITVYRHDFMSPERSGIFQHDADYAATLDLIRSAAR